MNLRHVYMITNPLFLETQELFFSLKLEHATSDRYFDGLVQCSTRQCREENFEKGYFDGLVAGEENL